MGKAFINGTLAYIIGAAIGLLLVILFLRIGWQDKEKTLVLGYGGLCTFGYFFYTTTMRFKKEEIDSLNERINKKADLSEITILKGEIKSITQMQEENLSISENTFELISKHVSDNNVRIDLEKYNMKNNYRSKGGK